jgi:hypothetical protein
MAGKWRQKNNNFRRNVVANPAQRVELEMRPAGVFFNAGWKVKSQRNRL